MKVDLEWKLVGVSALLVAAYLVGSTMKELAPPSNPARGACIGILQKLANDPGSVELVAKETWPISVAGAETTVTMTFRAKNGFGALTLHTAVCKVRHDGDMWRMVAFDEV